MLAVLVPSTSELAELWRRELFIECRWSICAEQAGVLGYVVDGEAGGHYVVGDRWPRRRAYRKPRRLELDPQKARAAREKICADLAFEVGCRVPPVVLSRRVDAPANEERACCISLVMHRRQIPWEQLRGFLENNIEGTEAVRDGAPAGAALAFAFDTWVAQTDHADHHPHNVVFAYADFDDDVFRGSEFVFLDYAMALGWAGTWDLDPLRLAAVPFPPALVRAIDRIALDGILDRIENLPEATISTIVNRIPNDYLVAQQRDVILRGLLARRERVRDFITARGV